MKKGLSLKTALTALAASFVWGTAFAFQRMAAGHIGAITFNFYRSVLAALALVTRDLLCRMRANRAALRDAKGGQAA